MTFMVAKGASRANHHTNQVIEAVDALSYAVADCDLGKVLVARSGKGVCSILLGDNAQALATDLAVRFPDATLTQNEDAMKEDLAKVLRYIETPATGLDFTLDVRGTPFQRRVWEQLRAIPAGSTVTYRELARRVGPSASPRAIGSACAANAIALAIPCHRVVRSDGDLAGYRWGIDRKRALIEREVTA